MILSFVLIEISKNCQYFWTWCPSKLLIMLRYIDESYLDRSRNLVLEWSRLSRPPGLIRIKTRKTSKTLKPLFRQADTGVLTPTCFLEKKVGPTALLWPHSILELPKMKETTTIWMIGSKAFILKTWLLLLNRLLILSSTNFWIRLVQCFG